ncbi:MAG: hypothetical protein OEM60_01185 [Gammaproteobacteria bacterium]|nr:hypothetical protein [Gammaproteobacteria bacterium]
MERVRMKQVMKQITIGLYVLTTLAGCATVQPAGPDNEESVEIEAKSRTKSTLLTIGSILLVGAIIVSEAEDGAKDAVRDAARP